MRVLSEMRRKKEKKKKNIYAPRITAEAR